MGQVVGYIRCGKDFAALDAQNAICGVVISLDDRLLESRFREPITGAQAARKGTDRNRVGEVPVRSYKKYYD